MYSVLMFCLLMQEDSENMRLRAMERMDVCWAEDPEPGSPGLLGNPLQ
jgi:hypothetical protein